MEKKWLFSILISLAMILVACGSEETAKEDNNNEESLPQSTENNGDQGEETMEAEEEDTTEDEENDAAKTAVSETEIMNPAIAEESQGDVEVIYTNTQPNYSADFDGLQVKVNAYQIVKVTDIHASQEPRFDGLEGYVVTADATIENTSDKRLRYNANMRIQLADKFDYIPSQTRYYIAEEKQLKWDRPEDISTFEPGFKKDYYLTFLFTNEEFEQLKSVEPKFVIEGGVSENEDFSGSFGDDVVFDFIYSEEHGQEVANAPDFYQDRLTKDNWARKEMIFEKTDINETQELDGLKITLEGVQYAKVIPNETSKERFRNFDSDELVALTAKVTFDNGIDQLVQIGMARATLTVNDTATYISSRMVEEVSPDDLPPGDTGERYIVFLFEPYDFEDYRSFHLKVGPFSGEDGELFKGHSVEFELPR